MGVKNSDAGDSDSVGGAGGMAHMLPVAIAGDGFGIAPSRWYFPDKVRTTLQNVTVKRISATFEAGVDGGPGAFRRPSAAGLGEPGAVREGFCMLV